MNKASWRRVRAGAVCSALTFAVAPALAGSGGSASAPEPRLPWPGIAPAYARVYPYAGACWLYGACLWWDDRRAPRRPTAPDSPSTPPEQDLWGTTGSPWGYVRRLPAPTPDSQIQPRYREASTIRPEFSER